jgi:polar amino acid transport system substrate-binding protein
MRTLLLRCLFLLAAVPLCHPSHAETWTFRADSFCPYNCDPAGPNPGYMVEILQRAARSHGHTLDYKLMPWPRALEQARDGKITGVIAMVINDQEGLLVSNRLGVEANCLFVKKGSALSYGKPADLNNFGRIGIVEGYGYPEEFEKWKTANVRKVQALAGDNTLEMQAKKLASGHIDAFLENVNVVRYAEPTIPELKSTANAGCLSSVGLFAGYSKKNPKAKEIKAQIDQELTAMKNSGELRKLLDKYRVAPW